MKDIISKYALIASLAAVSVLVVLTSKAEISKQFDRWEYEEHIQKCKEAYGSPHAYYPSYEETRLLGPEDGVTVD